MVVDAAKQYGSDKVLVTSFTKAAAVELVGRNLPIDKDHVGTLHAICYRALGMPPIAETRMSEWTEAYPALVMTASAAGNDDPSWDASSRTETDRMMAAYQTQRSRMVAHEALEFDGVMGHTEFLDFVNKWQDFKEQNGYLDFTDMLEIAYRDFETAPDEPDIMFLDEAQDLAPLELALARKWATHMDRLVLAGDDDQCQPPETMVLTTSGEKRIADLDPETDRLVSIDRPGAEVRKCGYGFEKASRPYDGQIIRISAGGASSRSTTDHQWLVRWNKKAVKDAHVVYMMRQGGRYRVGWCKLFRSDSVLHLGMRARNEHADEAWILYVTNDRTEASIMESYIAAEYGLPTITFEPVSGATHMTRESIDSLFEMFSPSEHAARARYCIESFGGDSRYPIWAQDKTHRGGVSNFLVRACNILDGLMQVPIPDEKLRRYSWHDASIRREHYEGEVYSLAVETHPYYVADGIITHNCLYQFKGSDPQEMFGTAPRSETVLSQSYRIPRAVHALATEWSRHLSWRIEKEYAPRDADGFVEKLWDADFGDPGTAVAKAKELAAEGKTVMFLASCSYMLRDTIAALKDAGVPIHNPYKVRRGDWNPLAVGNEGRNTATDRVMAYCKINPQVFGRDAHVWDANEFRLWATQIKATDLFKYGAKTHIASSDFVLPPDDAGRLEAIGNLLRPESADLPDAEHFSNALDGNLDWLYARLAGEAGKRMRYPVDIARAMGARTLLERPKVTVGTIHSVKGGEADVVILYPDVSWAGQQEWNSVGPRRDSVRRLFYVAMTRAREGLYLCGNSGQSHVALWSGL